MAVQYEKPGGSRLQRIREDPVGYWSDARRRALHDARESLERAYERHGGHAVPRRVAGEAPAG